MPAGFAYEPVVENILQAENFGADKLYLYDDTDNKNSYKGNNLLYAAYLALNIPWQRFNVYAGVRLENRNMTLKMCIRDRTMRMLGRNMAWLLKGVKREERPEPELRVMTNFIR